MRLTPQDKDKIFNLVTKGYGSRRIANELDNKISFQAVSIHVKRIKEGVEKQSINAKLDRIIELLEDMSKLGL